MLGIQAPIHGRLCQDAGIRRRPAQGRPQGIVPTIHGLGGLIHRIVGTILCGRPLEAAGCYPVTGLLVGYGWVMIDPLVLAPGGAMVGDALAPATTCSVVTGGAGGPAFD